MVCKNRGIYGFWGTSWVLITMAPRNSWFGPCLARIARNPVHRCHPIILCTTALWAPEFAQPGWAIFTAKAAVVNFNEIAQDSPSARVYRQGRYPRAWDWWKELYTKNVTSYIHRTRFFEKCSYVRPLLIDGGAVKKMLGHNTRKNKSNLEPHFPSSATKSRCLEDTKTAVALPQCSESTKESIAGWWAFGSEVRLELWRNYTNIVRAKKNGGRGASSRGFVGSIGFCHYFYCGRCNIGVSNADWHLYANVDLPIIGRCQRPGWPLVGTLGGLRCRRLVMLQWRLIEPTWSNPRQGDMAVMFQEKKTKRKL